MSSTSGLTRRRGGGGGAAGGAAATPEAESSNGNINRTNSSSNFKDNAPETSYESSENGHKIAFDPRDISESTERSKQPKLTLMEEVLLLGLKDKQVRRWRSFYEADQNTPTAILNQLTNATEMRRAISLSGTTTYPTLYVDASCWSSPSVAELACRKMPRDGVSLSPTASSKSSTTPSQAKYYSTKL